MLFPNHGDWERRFGKRPRWQPEKVEALGAKLLRFLEWSRVAEPQDLFQEVVHRLIAKVSENPALLDMEDPSFYVIAIARYVVQEARKKKRRETAQLARDHPRPQSAFRRLSQIEMGILINEIRRLLTNKEWELMRLAVLGDTEAWRIREGISPGALRVRIHRIRRKLEQFGLGPPSTAGGENGN